MHARSVGITAPITILRSRNPCQGYPSAEFDIDTLYYQWVPFFLFFQVRGTLMNATKFTENAQLNEPMEGCCKK